VQELAVRISEAKAAIEAASRAGDHAIKNLLAHCA
jgi:hypothetical protein